DSTRQNGVEIIVQMRDGQRRAVIQGVTADAWAPGDPVIVIVTGGNARIARAPQVSPAPAYPAPTAYPAPHGLPAPAAYPDAPVQPVYPPSGPAPTRRRSASPSVSTSVRRIFGHAGPPAST